MARGTPVVASNSGGPTESVRHLKSGFLLDKDPGNWTRVMNRIKDNEMERNEISRFAKEYACREFSLKFMGEKLAKEISLA
jgi:alpha-1,3/alpha-1,6-mannosyltransferase